MVSAVLLFLAIKSAALTVSPLAVKESDQDDGQPPASVGAIGENGAVVATSAGLACGDIADEERRCNESQIEGCAEARRSNASGGIIAREVDADSLPQQRAVPIRSSELRTEFDVPEMTRDSALPSISAEAVGPHMTRDSALPSISEEAVGPHMSLSEVSTSAHAAMSPLLGLRAARTCGFCMFLTMLAAMIYKGLKDCTGRCSRFFSMGDSTWFAQHGRYKAFRVLVCVHRLQGGDPETEYTVSAITRPSNKSYDKPSSTSLDASRLEGGVPLAAHSLPSSKWPALLEVMLPPSRPILQLAVYTKPGSFAPPKYLGCVSIDVADTLVEDDDDDGSTSAKQVELDLEELELPVKTEKQRDKGHLVVSFYKEGRDAKRFSGWGTNKDQQLPLSVMCTLEQAAERVRMQSPSNIRVSKAAVLASVLTGNFLVANKVGVFVPRYFDMVLKKKRWFWVWHHRAHPDWPDPFPVDESNRRKGFLPVRSIISAFVLAEDKQGFLVRYRAEDKTTKELVLARTDRSPRSRTDNIQFADCVRGRDELLFALRALRDDVLHGDAEEAGEDGGSNFDMEDDRQATVTRSRSRSPSVPERAKTSSTTTSGSRHTLHPGRKPEAPRKSAGKPKKAKSRSPSRASEGSSD